MRQGIGFAVAAALFVSVGGVAYGQTARELNERLSEVEERLDEVEKKTVLDRISLSGDYRTIFNAFIYNDGRGGGNQVTEELWSHRIRINLKAEPVRSVRITARLAAYKHFGDNDSPSFVLDYQRSRLPRDTIARFDQAWIDWFITDWLALSGGRIAYSGGPPADLSNNSPTRQATWGSGIVDGEYDTLNLTFRIPGRETYFRLFYASYFFDREDNELPTTAFLDNGTDALRVFGGDIEFSLPNLGRNLFQFAYVFIPRWTLFPAAIDDPARADPDFIDTDFRNAPGPLSASNIFPSRTPDSLGSWQSLYGLIILYDLLESGFDVFVTGQLGFINSSNEGIEYEIPAPGNPNGPRRSTPLLFFPGTEEDGQVITTFLYAGFRYTVPIDALNRPKIGFEFNMGSRYHITLQQPTERIISKFETRGSAYETYAILPINRSLFIRAGYLFIQRDYDFTFAGPNPATDPSGSTAPPVNEQLHNFHLTLSASI